MASYFWREIFYVPFPGTPGKIPGNSGSTELRKEFGTTLFIVKSITLAKCLCISLAHLSVWSLTQAISSVVSLQYLFIWSLFSGYFRECLPANHNFSAHWLAFSADSFVQSVDFFSRTGEHSIDTEITE